MEENVGGDVEIIENAELLVDKLDTERACFAWRTYLDGLAIDYYRAAVARDRTTENFHQGGFARAVLTDQRDDFTGAHAQADVIERDDAGKSLTDILHLEDGRAHWHRGFAADEHRRTRIEYQRSRATIHVNPCKSVA